MTVEIGQDACARIADRAAEQMRAAIEETGGREVFFAGSLNGHALVERVRVVARGTSSAVPALFDNLKVGEIVLHNHPGGNISPSDEDLELSSMLGRNGHGVYIVNNDITKVYVVVEPLLDKEKRFLDGGELTKVIASDSRIARSLPGYEVRPQQVEMMEAAAGAFNRDGIAVVEAPTGVGKTLAYLLPAIWWAVRNRERVVVSTRTINLQEQIVSKDIPLLQRCLKERFSAVLVKGRGNYICLRRLERALSEAALFDEEGERETLQAIAAWAEKTNDGSRSDLTFVPEKGVWDKVCSEADTCAGLQCGLAQRCFVTKARREVAKADLIVANHHMLFSDLAIKKEMGSFTALAVLPAYRRVIFDEAHSIEDSATEYFGVQITRNGALALLGRFAHEERGRERGVLPYLKVKLVREVEGLPPEALNRTLELIDNDLLPAVAAAREAAKAAFDALRSLTADQCGQVGRDIKWRLTAEALAHPELREIHSVYVLPAVEELTQCAQHCNALCELLKRVKPSRQQIESPVLTELAQLEGYRDRLHRLANALAEGTSDHLEPNTVRWIEIDAARPDVVRIVRCLLDVGEVLAGWVYRNLKTVIMTSATLSVQRNFDYLFSRIGLDRIGDRELTAMSLESPFDFREQALMCIPRDIAAPDDKRFLEESVDCIRRALAITKGHAFVLFTSFYALAYAHKALEQELRNQGIASLRQGQASRTQLLNRFRSDASSVLFATDSFWEGVDVAGEALQCVILPKLPFRVPTEPILQARAEAIEASGGNSFMTYTVPQAVIKFRQGFGRLIRRRSDRGAVVLLDRRVLTKFYGRVFLESLPGVRIVSGASKGVFAALAKFFGISEEDP